MTTEKCPLCGSDQVRALAVRTLLESRWTLGRCRSCGLHFTSPFPTEEDIASFYTGDFHQELRAEGATEAIFGSKYKRYVEMLERYLPSGRVVDVGCSTGLLVRMLRDRGYEAEGLELNPRSAEWGRAHYAVPIHATPLEQSEYDPGSLDAILMTDVLEHTRHPGDFLCEAARRLRPGGLALVTFPDIRSLESGYQRLLSILLRRGWLWRTCHFPLHVWEFTRATAEACLTRAGFRVVEFGRHQDKLDVESRGLALTLLDLPTQPLHWPVVRRLFGTQMEFIITKIGDFRALRNETPGCEEPRAVERVRPTASRPSVPAN